MAESDKHEPAMVVKQSKILWILVFAILWLAYTVSQVPLMIEKILHREHMNIQKTVDHEMDDANDNYEQSLNLILQAKGAEEILRAFHCNLTPDEIHRNAETPPGRHH
tara:strand:+ start:349 stop:672 length:324 start_codon:yes stop_codon:yes gene_type:complete